MLRDVRRALLCLLLLASALGPGAAVWAAPNGAASPAPASAPPARPAVPDYGGRNGSLGSALDGGGTPAAAPDPLAQTGRAFEALVIVLALVGGGLVLLKRSGLLKGDGTLIGKGGLAAWALGQGARGRPSSGVGVEDLTEMLALLGSQPLPHSPGAGLHLVSVGGRVLLLGATAQSVTLLTEVAEVAEPPARESDTPEEAAAFADYLARVGMTSPEAAVKGTATATLSAATDRLQSLLAPGHGRRT